MTYLLDLLAEIILHIAAHLPPQKARFIQRPWPDVVDPERLPRDLMRLCCTCSALRDIVQPLVFRSTFVYFRNTAANGAFANLVNTFKQRTLLTKNSKHLLFTSQPSVTQTDENNNWRVKFPKLALPMLASMVNVTTLHFQSSRLETSPHLGHLLCNKPIANNGQLHLPNLIALFISPSNGTEMVL
jgi:hypothetical protein